MERCSQISTTKLLKSIDRSALPPLSPGTNSDVYSPKGSESSALKEGTSGRDSSITWSCFRTNSTAGSSSATLVVTEYERSATLAGSAAEVAGSEAAPKVTGGAEIHSGISTSGSAGSGVSWVEEATSSLAGGISASALGISLTLSVTFSCSAALISELTAEISTLISNGFVKWPSALTLAASLRSKGSKAPTSKITGMVGSSASFLICSHTS